MATSSNAQPVASDACTQDASNKYVVDAGCKPFQIHAGFAADYDPGGCGTLSTDAFAWFTATSDSTTIVIVPNNNADVGIQVFSGTCGSLTLLACMNDLGPTLVEDLTMFTVIGQDYMVRIQTYGALDSIPSGQLCVLQTPPQPSNSDPCSATLLPVTSICNSVAAGTNASSVTTDDIPNPCGYPGSSGDVWFKAVIPASGHLIIDTQSLETFDGSMSLYTAPGCLDHSQFDFVACDDDNSSTGNGMPQLDISSGLTPGDTAYIRFWAYFAAEDNFRICASNSTTTLPVEFLGVDAHVHDGIVDISWATASERNSDHFNIERSTDALAFSSIGQVPAAGNASSRIDYLFTDEDPGGNVSYYRVREVDTDGSSITTAVVAAFPSPKDDCPTIFPNPSGGEVHVVLPRPVEGSAQLVIRNALGLSALAVPVAVPHGQRSISFDSTPLAPGYYIVLVVLPSGEILRCGAFLRS